MYIGSSADVNVKVHHNDFTKSGLSESNNIYKQGGSLAGSGNKIQYNLGYTTENIGTATISNTNTVTFSHGLVATATHVFASFNCTGWGSWSWNASSTQITITTENSVNATVYWDARTWNQERTSEKSF